MEPTVIPCPSCHAHNPLGDKFCRSCGQSLAAPNVPHIRSHSTQYLTEIFKPWVLISIGLITISGLFLILFIPPDKISPTIDSTNDQRHQETQTKSNQEVYGRNAIESQALNANSAPTEYQKFIGKWRCECTWIYWHTMDHYFGCDDYHILEIAYSNGRYEVTRYRTTRPSNKYRATFFAKNGSLQMDGTEVQDAQWGISKVYVGNVIKHDRSLGYDRLTWRDTYKRF